MAAAATSSSAAPPPPPPEDMRDSVPHTLFSPRQHGAVQARASTATPRPGAAPVHDQGLCQAAPIRGRRRSRGRPAVGALGRGRHIADMERDGFDAGEVRRLRAEQQHHLGR